MATIAHIDHIGDGCITFKDKENAFAVINAMLDDKECTSEREGAYAVMISREEDLWRVDYRITFPDDPVVFESAYYVDKHYEPDEPKEYEQGEFDE